MSKRRRWVRQPLGRFLVPGTLWLAMILCGWGFVHLTQIALYRQEHGVLGAEHPYDWGAEGCLVLAMAGAALLLLTRPLRVRSWRKTHRLKAQASMDLTRPKAAKRRRERVQ